MMCVVGGKLAEGINFSDHLGRCGLSLPFRPWALQHCDVMLQRVERHQHRVNRMMTDHVLSVAQSACRSSTDSSNGICVPLPMVVMILAWHQPQQRIRLAMLHDGLPLRHLIHVSSHLPATAPQWSRLVCSAVLGSLSRPATSAPVALTG